MELLHDGVIAALSAIGLTAVIWVIAGAILHPRRRGTIDAAAVIPARGAAENLEYTVRALERSRYEEGGFRRIVILDCGLSDDALKVAEVLCRDDYDVTICQRETIANLFE